MATQWEQLAEKGRSLMENLEWAIALRSDTDELPALAPNYILRLSPVPGPPAVQYSMLHSEQDMGGNPDQFVKVVVENPSIAANPRPYLNYFAWTGNLFFVPSTTQRTTTSSRS